MKTRACFFTIMAVFFSFYGLCYGQQDTIKLINPSFEDMPRTAKPPRGWYDCGFDNETPPDVQPSGGFEVMKPAFHGATYLGMVVRDNDTWERVSQRLLNPIRGTQCYSFSLDLCRSELYVSQSRISDAPANYVTPVKLIIWGGDNYCAKKERLAETSLVSNTEWMQYDFKFEPKQSHTYIMLEAFYKTPVLFPYNGNVLVDNASSIKPIPCDEDPALVKIPEVDFTVPSGRSVRVYDKGFTVQANVKHIKRKENITYKVNGRVRNDFSFNSHRGILLADVTTFKEGRNTIVIQAVNEAGRAQDQAVLIYEPDEPAVVDAPITPETYEVPTPSVPLPATRKENKKIEGYTREDLKTGQTIPINRLYFKMDHSDINRESYSALNEIYEFLNANKDVVIEIGGHTSGLCDDEFCDKLSMDRAKAVVDYLENKGIATDRLKYKGYGKKRPIASNNTAAGRKKNQRVEIKILSMNG